MNTDDRYVAIAFIFLLLVTGFTLYSINKFMPVSESCDDDFELINRCKCVPCNTPLMSYFKTEEACKNYIGVLP